jgi:Tfp pilus assembly protein PilF
LYLTDKRFGEGRLQLERAVFENPTDPEPHLTFGDLAIRDQRVSDAEAQYERGAELLKQFKGSKGRTDDMTYKVHFGRYSVAQMRNQQVAAEKELRAALKLQPKNPRALLELGQLMFATGKADDAYKAFQASVAADKTQLPAELSMARRFQQKGELEKMHEWLQKAVEKSPQDLRVRVAMANAALMKHDVELAKTEADTAAKIDPKSAEVRALLGLVAYYQGDLSTAQRHLENAVEKTPGDFASSNLLALVLADQGGADKIQRALTLAKFNLDSNPRSSVAPATLAWVTYRAGGTAEAEQGMKSAMSAGDVGRDGAYYMARMLSDRGLKKDAAAVLQKCLNSTGVFVHLDDAKALQKELASN